MTKTPDLQKKYPSIRPFVQHGFHPKGVLGTQVSGLCPFCDHKRTKEHPTFYVNHKTQKWDCKSCLKAGGLKSFLKKISLSSIKNFKGRVAVSLHKERGLKISTLRKWNIGWNLANKTYTMPLPTVDEKTIHDLRYYKPGSRFYSTKGSKVGLLGWHLLGKPGLNKIWMCEGEWDGMALDEILTEEGVEDNAVVSVPGAGTFKDEWISFFKDKHVNVLFDNDDSGKQGSIKVYNRLKSAVTDLKFLHWPTHYDKGFDVRDYYKKLKRKSASAYKGIRTYLKEFPPNLDAKTKEILTKKTDGGSFKGKGLEAEEVYKQYRKWLHIPDLRVIDVVFGIVIANRMPGDPLWAFLVAPPGGMKSEMLMSLSKAVRIFTTTSLTPHSLVSGANFAGAADPSLIPKLDGQVAVIKDFTTILNMPQMIRDEIFGILRDAYDGRTEKHFGNGVFRRYESKFGMIAGVTPAIEIYTEGSAALGERFLMYRIPYKMSMRHTQEFIRRAMGNVGTEDIMRKELQETAKKALNYDFLKTLPTYPENILDKVMYLSQFTSMLRGTVVRDRYTKEITHKPFMELGTRLAKQFSKLLYGIAMFHRRDTINEDDYQSVLAVARDTIPGRLEEFVRKMYQKGRGTEWTHSDISKVLSLPPITCQRLAENLVLLKVLKVERQMSPRTAYQFTREALNLIKRTGVY